MTKTKKSLGSKVTLNAISDRVLELEKRPDILTLDPEQTYLVLLPESTLPTDFDNLFSVLQKYPNVVLLQADNLKVIQVT